MDRTGLVFHGESSDPDGNQTVLAVRQAEPGMSRDFEREAAFAASVDELVCRRLAQGQAAKDERSGVISEVLLVLLTLLADHLDGLEFLESLLRDSNLWEDRIQRRNIVAVRTVVPDLTGWEPRALQTLPSARGLRRAKAERRRWRHSSPPFPFSSSGKRSGGESGLCGGCRNLLVMPEAAEPTE